MGLFGTDFCQEMLYFASELIMDPLGASLACSKNLPPVGTETVYRQTDKHTETIIFLVEVQQNKQVEAGNVIM